MRIYKAQLEVFATQIRGQSERVEEIRKTSNNNGMREGPN